MQAYSSIARAIEPHALPDVEVFYVHAMPRRAYDRAYTADFCDDCDGVGCENCPPPGWYYWFCLPGCLPTSDPSGPFDDPDLAVADARLVAGE